MIEETIAKIEARLRESELPPERRAELHQLLAELRSEARASRIGPIPAAHQEEDDARSAISRLEENLTAFESSHPKLIGLVNRISAVLSNMGI